MRRDLVSRCVKMTSVNVNGEVVAADYRIRLIINGEYAGTLRAAPTMIEEAATGLLLARGKAQLGECTVLERIKQLGELEIAAWMRLRRTPYSCRVGDADIGVEEAWNIYRDFAARLPKQKCPVAVHRLALYEIKDRPIFLTFVADPSRHAAAYKVAGLVSCNRMFCGKPIVLVSTGRLSDDMVRVLSAVGIRVIISPHRPLLSGLYEAKRRGVKLVLQDAERMFKVY